MKATLQNILRKIKKSSKVRQNRKTLIFFSRIFGMFIPKIYFCRELDTRCRKQFWNFCEIGQKCVLIRCFLSTSGQAKNVTYSDLIFYIIRAKYNKVQVFRLYKRFLYILGVIENAFLSGVHKILFICCVHHWPVSFSTYMPEPFLYFFFYNFSNGFFTFVKARITVHISLC